MLRQLHEVVRLLELKWSEARVARELLPFHLTEQLAEGSMALVFNAINQQDGTNVVVKLPSPADGLCRIEYEISVKIDALCYEADLLETINRNHIAGVVRLIANRTDSPLPLLVLEKLGESVESALDDVDSFETQDCLTITRDVAAILERLHSITIFHYDIKPANILRGPNGWTLIDPAAQDFHTLEYFENRTAVGPARDILALGRTFLQMYFGYCGEVDIPPGDGLDIEDSLFYHCLRRMLGRTRYSIPNATHVRRLASRTLAQEYDIPSARFPASR